MNVYIVAILILVGIYAATLDQRKFRCPACDFTCEKEDERAAKAHMANCLVEAAKHKPGLK